MDYNNNNILNLPNHASNISMFITSIIFVLIGVVGYCYFNDNEWLFVWFFFAGCIFFCLIKDGIDYLRSSKVYICPYCKKIYFLRYNSLPKIKTCHNNNSLIESGISKKTWIKSTNSQRQKIVSYLLEYNELTAQEKITRINEKENIIKTLINKSNSAM